MTPALFVFGPVCPGAGWACWRVFADGTLEPVETTVPDGSGGYRRTSVLDEDIADVVTLTHRRMGWGVLELSFARQ